MFHNPRERNEDNEDVHVGGGVRADWNIALGFGALIGFQGELDTHVGVVDVSHRMYQSNEETSSSSISITLADRELMKTWPFTR